MSASTREWLVVLIFFLFAFGLTLVEAIWLNKKNWASFGKALAFAVTTNVIGFFVGFFVMFIVFGVILAMAWDGSLQKIGNAGIIAALVFGALFFPVFLALCKRLFLMFLKMQTGKAAWIFAFACSFLIVFLSLGVPILFGYLLF